VPHGVGAKQLAPSNAEFRGSFAENRNHSPSCSRVWARVSTRERRSSSTVHIIPTGSSKLSTDVNRVLETQYGGSTCLTCPPLYEAWARGLRGCAALAAPPPPPRRRCRRPTPGTAPWARAATGCPAPAATAVTRRRAAQPGATPGESVRGPHGNPCQFEERSRRPCKRVCFQRSSLPPSHRLLGETHARRVVTAPCAVSALRPLSSSGVTAAGSPTSACVASSRSVSACTESVAAVSTSTADSNVR
jgi:hypothetical protein